MSKSKYEDETSIRLRISRAQKAEIAAKADAENMSLTDYMIRTALRRQINHGNSADIINELRVLGEQQRELAGRDRRNEHQYQKLLDTIVTTLLSIPRRLSAPSKSSPWKPDHGMRVPACKPFK